MVGRQRNCPTKFHADKNSHWQVRLANNTTNNCGVADCMAGIQVDQFSMEKEETTDVEYLDGAVEHVRKASGTRPDLANWPSGPLMVQKSIVPAYSM